MDGNKADKPVLTLSILKEEARRLKRSSVMSHTAALEVVAKKHGFTTWHAATKSLDKGVVDRIPKPEFRASEDIAESSTSGSTGVFSHDIEMLTRRHGLSGNTVAEIVASFVDGFMAGRIHTRNCDNEPMNLLHSGNTENQKAGIQLLEGLAGVGHSGAAYNLAVAKLDGSVIEPDPSGANLLCEQALLTAEDPRLRGLIMNTLAQSKMLGRGCEIDHLSAVNMFEQAAMLGCADAAFNAGLYWHGKVKSMTAIRDYDRAATMYALAADLGNVAGQTNLGLLHYTEAMTPSDSEHGRRLLELSQLQGDHIAKATIKMVEDARRQSGRSPHGSPPGGYRAPALTEATPGNATHADLKMIGKAILGDRGWKPVMEISEQTLKTAADSPVNGLTGGKECQRLDALKSKFLIEFFVENRSSGSMNDDSFDFYLGQATTQNNRRRLVSHILDERKKRAQS